jgi:hypothetical protein
VKPSGHNVLVVPPPISGGGAGEAGASRPGTDDDRWQAEQVYLTEAELQFIDYLVDMAEAAWKRS